MAIASITVMLWIMWSDTIRARRPSPVLYAVRIALFLIVAGVLVLNMVRQPQLFRAGARWLTIVAAGVGILGAGYFARRLTLRK